MTSPEQIEQILNRIERKQQTSEDINVLRHNLVSGDHNIVKQLGKYNVNIGEGKDIHIGDCNYYSWNEEALKALIKLIQLQENSKQSNELPRWKRRSFITFVLTSFFAAAGFRILNQENNKELAITCVRQYLKNSPTIISNLSYSLPIKQYSKSSSKRTGVLTSYWQIFLSNNTDKTISIIKYKLLQVAKAFPATDYTGMNQGIYEENSNGEIHDLRFPVIINPGITINIIVKIGIQLEPDAYKLVKDKIKEEPKISFGSMEKFLWSNGMDFYGNKVTALQYGIEYDFTSYQFTSLDKVQEQIFKVNFKTSQGVNISKNISIYSSLYNEVSGRSC